MNSISLIRANALHYVTEVFSAISVTLSSDEMLYSKKK